MPLQKRQTLLALQTDGMSSDFCMKSSFGFSGCWPNRCRDFGLPFIQPVAEYVKAVDKSGEHGTPPDGESWEDWLQTHRVELNAMTTPQFIAWLDRKMAKRGSVGKLIPPADVLKADLAERIEKKVRATLTERILREADLDGQVEAAIKKIGKPSAATLAKGIRQSFQKEPKREWRDHIEAVAKAKTNVDQTRASPRFRRRGSAKR